MNEQRLELGPHGRRIGGSLPLPAGLAARVVTGPLTPVKEQVAAACAKAMAARRFAALALDHRYLGESSGSLRRFWNLTVEVEDRRAT